MSAILIGAASLNDANFYQSAGGSPDNATSFGGTLAWVPRAGSSATRVLLSGLQISPTRGFDIRTTGTNALVSVIFANGGGGGQGGGAASLASVLNKFCAFSFTWDGPNNRLRVFLNRVEIGSGTTITGHLVGDGPVRLGGALTGGAPGTDNEPYGFNLWSGLASLAQVQSQHDAIMANDGRIQRTPDVANAMLVDLMADAQANGGTLGASLVDRINGNNLARTGAPTTSPQYARSFGW